ncbi:MAG TPA: RNA degradosome polyphosphate kinase [Acidimicrobiales bacterium]|nr:RNA degradosome polyphosphate kinase [Acidimicrobiales bacterium]
MTDAMPPPSMTDPDRLLNRELSWLDFNARVLALAADPTVPLLERSKFLAIFAQNLDEYFQVRVAGLLDQVAAGITSETADGRTPGEQLSGIHVRATDLTKRHEHIFLDQVVPELADCGIRFSSWDELDLDDRKHLVETFDERIYPVLTPLAVDPGHPFPYISDLSLNLAVDLRDPKTGMHRFARVKVPSLLSRFVVLPDGERFVPLEQVIAAHLDRLFGGMEVLEASSFRVTRNADLTLEEEEAEDLLAAVEIELRRRRFGKAVRLEVDAEMSDPILALLKRELDVADEDVYRFVGPLDLSGLWGIAGLDRPDLKDPSWTGLNAASLVHDADEPVDMFEEISEKDILLHHPYISFSATVDEFIRQASVDPMVQAIKMTLYRTSGDSPIVQALIRASERGKQVAVLVELKARFDEAANIEWARALEESGVHVVYGLVGLKTHTKTALVVRNEPDGLKRYCHVGTGNYNDKTAKIYEDLGLLTADDDIGEDLTHLFNHLTGYSRENEYRKLVVAPMHMRNRLLALIATERDLGPDGRIVMKMNSLVDPKMIDALYAASSAGVSIDLIVRGICCLRPGVPGLSDHIRVRSIVGRYLEHSRIYHFANGEGEGSPVYLIGSADLMQRNLDGRVEALVPVEEPLLQRRLAEVLEVNLSDDTLAWELDGDGVWHHVEVRGSVDTHLRLQELARARVASAT